jgi:hypothetical protein
MSLAPKTPDDVVEVFRRAFEATTHDPNFLQTNDKIEHNLTFRSNEDVEYFLRVPEETPPEAVEFISLMLRNQGLTTN